MDYNWQVLYRIDDSRSTAVAYGEHGASAFAKMMVMMMMEVLGQYTRV